MSYANMVEFAALNKELHHLEAYEISAERRRKMDEMSRDISVRSYSFLRWISKKAVFITSVPFYWFIIFRYIIGTFDIGLFIFIVGVSFFMSFFGINWGILNGFAR